MTNNPETEIYEIESEDEMLFEDEVASFFDDYGSLDTATTMLENFDEDMIREIMRQTREKLECEGLDSLFELEIEDIGEIYAKILAIGVITKNEELIEQTEEIYLNEPEKLRQIRLNK